MKIFFDIGVNRFQGYNEISERLNINEEWIKVFVEPNLNFTEDIEWLETLKKIPNSNLISGALCCTCQEDYSQLMFLDGFDDFYQGASILNETWEKENLVKKSMRVKNISFHEIAKHYKNDEWYIKMDCENCEYSCLKGIIDSYHKNIKLIIVEFHYPAPSGYENYRNEVFDMANKYNISIEEWK